jgi:hypothetical protein
MPPKLIELREAPTERETIVRILRDIRYQIDQPDISDAEKLSYIRSKLGFLIAFISGAR